MVKAPLGVTLWQVAGRYLSSYSRLELSQPQLDIGMTIFESYQEYYSAAQRTLQVFYSYRAHCPIRNTM